jgi:hypothetical protein
LNDWTTKNGKEHEKCSLSSTKSIVKKKILAQAKGTTRVFCLRPQQNCSTKAF